MLTYSVNKTINYSINQYAIICVCIFIYCILSFVFINDYLRLSMLQIGAMIAYVVLAPIQTTKKANNYVLVFSLVAILLYWHTQITTLLYLSSLILSIEFLSIFFGRLSINAYVMALLCSPIFTMVSSIIGFPLRLKLTYWSSEILNLCIQNCSAEGNQLVINQQPFIIDEACAGLHMLLAGFVFAVLLVEHFKKKHQQTLSMLALFSFYGFVLISIITNNIIRICMLVLFKIFPENSMHYGIGIIGFIVYTMIPTYFVLKYLFKKFGKDINTKQTTTSNIQQKVSYALFITIITIGTYTMIFEQNKMQPVADLPIQYLSHYEKENLDYDIVKYKNNNELIYVKPMPYFFSSEHNPLYCWKGSGYKMKQFKKHILGSNTIFIGDIVKNNSTIHTAWFYSNGKICTTEQLEWRWKSFIHQEPFYLISVSSSSKTSLINLADQLIKENTK